MSTTEIYNRMNEIEKKVERLVLLNEQALAHLERHEQHLSGDPASGQPGIVVKLDRVEQWKARHTKLMWILLGAVCGGLVERVWTLMLG